MEYYLNIKSHTEAPDFETTVEADSLEEAVKKLQGQYDLDEKVILASIEGETLCGEPHNNGDNDWESCNLCGVIKLNL